MNIKKIIFGITAVAVLSLINSFPAFAESGDANSDGNIDALDASAILTVYAQNATGNSVNLTAQQKADYDVTSDGNIDAIDASYVLGYYAYCAVTTDSKMSLADYIKDSNSKPKTLYAADFMDMNAKQIFDICGTYNIQTTGYYGGLSLAMTTEKYPGYVINFIYNEQEKVNNSDKPVLIHVADGYADSKIYAGMSIDKFAKAGYKNPEFYWNAMDEIPMISIQLRNGISMNLFIESEGNVFHDLFNDDYSASVSLDSHALQYLTSKNACISEIMLIHK